MVVILIALLLACFDLFVNFLDFFSSSFSLSILTKTIIPGIKAVIIETYVCASSLSSVQWQESLLISVNSRVALGTSGK